MRPLLAWLVLLLGALPAHARQSPGEPEEDSTTRFFAVPMVRETRELADLAEEHLAAGRESEAMAVLQRLLEDHAGEVLPDPGSGDSTFPRYPGVTEWALARLFELGPEARELYRSRHAARARTALELARRTADRRALASVAQRWPLAPAAQSAWIALGDLELEAGEREAARLCYEEARTLARRLGEPEPDLAARLALVPAPLEAPTARAAALPRRDAAPWKTALDLSPFGPRGGSPRHNLFPLLAGERLLVSSTLRVYALDAFSGERLWQFGPPRGWSRLSTREQEGLFVGLSGQLVSTPAAGSGVVVAALQLPFSENESTDWQGIEIMKAIPERRLFALDLATGRELWNHAPPLEFDGDLFRWNGGGSFAQRMMVAGPPVVAGTRVLVPCYRMQGRIDYHVACYDLATGALLWSTQLISGQRERNMFGRAQFEFCASPLTVSGARVVAQTELGTLAALDLFSGRLLWESTYRQIDLPKTRHYQTAPRPLTWRLTAPLVAGELVVATPSDSSELLALRLADGGVLWSYSEEQLQALDPETRQEGFNVLVGADEDTVYLGGGKLSALQKPGGLASSARFVPRWTNVLGRVDTSPRAVLRGEVLLAPSGIARTAFDRRTGERLDAASGDWNEGESGNLWLTDGALFTLSSSGAFGYFDWQTLLERARVAARESGDPARIASAARLFLRRGLLLAGRGEHDAARAVLSEAASGFAALRAADPAVDRGEELACTLALAGSLAATGRERTALELLAAARTLGPDEAEDAALLYLEEDILAAGGAERIARLDALAERHAARAVPETNLRRVLAAWLAGRPTAADGVLPLVPTLAFVRLERAGERVRASDLAGALEDLHALLAEGPVLELARGVTLDEVARERIVRVLGLGGGLEAHARFEERAAAALAAAGDDDLALRRVQTRYPFTRAAEGVLARRLERAVAARDPGAVAELLSETRARAGLTREREEELFLHLAHLLAEVGHPACERAWLAALARRAPERRSPLPGHEGLAFGELAARLPAEPAPGAAEVRFTAAAVGSGRPREGLHTFLGELRGGAAGEEGAGGILHVYSTREGLVAFAAEAPARSAWTYPLELGPERGEGTTACAGDVLVVAGRERLIALDGRGTERWSRPLAAPARRLATASGLVVLLTRTGEVQALDAHLGLALWTLTLEGDGGWNGPLLDGERALFFAGGKATPARVRVVDLFLGREQADLVLPPGTPAAAELEESAWLDEERLVVPVFASSPGFPAHIAAFELEHGRRVWSLAAQDGEELHAIARVQDESYAIALGSSLGAGASGGSVYRLDARSGSQRRIAQLRPGERPVGLPAGRVLALPEPQLFVSSYSDEKRGLEFRALSLAYGPAWTWSLSVAQNEFYDGRELALPALSDSTVALAVPLRRAGANALEETTLVFLDRRSGRKLDLRVLGASTAAGRGLALRGLGPALFLQSRNSLEILETPR